MYIHNSTMDIHNSVLGINNSIMDIEIRRLISITLSMPANYKSKDKKPR